MSCRVDPSINSVILLIGLAVGIDYSLFYLRRAREERARGHGRAPRRCRSPRRPPAGPCCSPASSVMTAMAGMFLMGSRTFASFGVGTVLVVAIALLGSLTVLPAVLSKLGDRVERGRIPLLARLRGARRRVAPVGRRHRRRDAPPAHPRRRGRGRARRPGDSRLDASTRSTRACRASRATCP